MHSNRKYTIGMRRKEREVVDLEIIQSWMKEIDICRIGMVDEGKVYIVPLNYGFTYTDHLCIYFHSAKVGRKMDVLKQNPNVSFELDGRHELMDADLACKVSMSYVSIMGEGRIEFIQDPQEKKKGLIEILKKTTGRSEFTLEDRSVDVVEVYYLHVESLSAKQHLPR